MYVLHTLNLCYIYIMGAGSQGATRAARTETRARRAAQTHALRKPSDDHLSYFFKHNMLLLFMFLFAVFSRRPRCKLTFTRDNATDGDDYDDEYVLSATSHERFPEIDDIDGQEAGNRNLNSTTIPRKPGGNSRIYIYIYIYIYICICIVQGACPNLARCPD